ncbi:hypothetical protein FB451DRAFT_1385910 [Mycena latifolia]|nr:hypothetical protein FB451DRAFT_1385910 [Mycena latifolia]
MFVVLITLILFSAVFDTHMLLGSTKVPMAAPIHQFIDCPRDGCPNRIPSVLVCRGKYVPFHRGLEYQTCGMCTYFQWLDPDQVAAAERWWQESPANGAPPYPPPEFPEDPYSASPRFADWSSTRIDPDLLQLSYAPQPLPSTPNAATPPPSQPIASSQSAKPNVASVQARGAGTQGIAYNNRPLVDLLHLPAGVVQVLDGGNNIRAATEEPNSRNIFASLPELDPSVSYVQIV